MLTLRHILLWERLTRKPFGRFNGSDENDVLSLMYCWDETHQRETSLAVYLQAARFVAKERHAFLRDVNRELAYIAQFSHDDDDGHPAKHEDVNYTAIFQSLVFQGRLDAGWLLGQSLELLPIFSEGMTKQYQREQSDKKFWTMLQMSPHMTKQGQRKLQNSLTFDWEKQKEGKLTTKQEMALGPLLFKTIMKTHPSPPVKGGRTDTL